MINRRGILLKKNTSRESVFCSLVEGPAFWVLWISRNSNLFVTSCRSVNVGINYSSFYHKKTKRPPLSK